MNIVAITACTSGIAHTYIAREKLLAAAKELGHEIKVETQGTIGIENRLTEGDIKNADVVIIAADINIAGKERFTNKKIVDVPIQIAVKSPKSFLKRVEEKLSK